MAVKQITELNTHSDVRNKDNTYGLYAYRRKRDDVIMYIGKDSYISRGSRRSDHQSERKVKDQWWHPILQKGINHYSYEVIDIVANNDWLDELEMSLIYCYKKMGQCEWNTENPLKEIWGEK